MKYLSQALKTLVLLALAAIPSVTGGGLRKTDEKNDGGLDHAERRRLFESRYLAAPEDKKIPGEFILEFTPGLEEEALKEVKKFCDQHGSKIMTTYTKTLHGVAIEDAPEDALKAWAFDYIHDFNKIEEDQEVILGQTAASTWGLDRIDERDLPLDGLYNLPTGVDGTGVDIYIVDTGINQINNEFDTSINMGDSFSVFGDSVAERTTDGNGHGTHVAGTAAGLTYGVAKRARLHSAKVFPAVGGTSNAHVIEGLEWAVRNQNDNYPTRRAVINMSLGGGFSTALNTAVRNAVENVDGEAGIVVVVAAGNENSNACAVSPASEPTAITVGSTNSSDMISTFSNWGTCVDILAPGSSILSAWVPEADRTATISGTSMASPHVAGAAALILQQDSSATPAEVSDTLRADATPDKITGDLNNSPNLLLYVAGTTVAPTDSPTTSPSLSPTFTGQTRSPTSSPNFQPTDSPTISPTTSPSKSPSEGQCFNRWRCNSDPWWLRWYRWRDIDGNRCSWYAEDPARCPSVSTFDLDETLAGMDQQFLDDVVNADDLQDWNIEEGVDTHDFEDDFEDEDGEDDDDEDEVGGIFAAKSSDMDIAHRWGGWGRWGGGRGGRGRCRRGYERIDGRCVRKCRRYFERINGECVRTSCPRHFTLINGRCVRTSCPNGFIFIDGKCIPDCVTPLLACCACGGGRTVTN